MRQCDNCDGTVSDDYHRVFSDNEGVLHNCWQCANRTANHNPSMGDDHFSSAATAERM